MPDATPAPAARWARRDVLSIALALPVLAGCSVSPAVTPLPGSSIAPGTPVTPGAVTPAPAPTVPAAATAELRLSAYAGAVLSGPHRKDLSAGQRRLLTFLRDAHADHGSVLASADPTARPTGSGQPPGTSAPDVQGLSLGDSLRRLARQESAQATAQREVAVSSTGLAALLAGSLATAADTYATALGADVPPGVAAAKARRAAPLLTDVAAAQQLVAQLHAVVYGYQLAIGKLKYASGARRRAVSELAAARRQLDVQIAFLLGREADVPAAEPAYVPSPDTRTASDAGRLVRGMQSRLEPFVGMTLAAAGTVGTRTAALTLLRSTTRTARSWGSVLQVWPGWPD